MSKKIVKYQNDFNKISIQNIGFTDGEMKMLMFMCAQAVEMKNSEIRITFSELKHMTELNKNFYTKKEFRIILKNFFDKLEKFRYLSENETDDETWTVFYGYKTDYEKEIITYFVTPKALYLFNELSEKYTKFEYEEMLLLKTLTGKQLYKFLKQWRFAGKATITVEQVRHLIDCSDELIVAQVTRKLKSGIDDLKKRIPFRYASLQMKTIKNGRTVTAYEFTFPKESMANENVIEIETTPVKFQSMEFFEKIKSIAGRLYDALVPPYADTMKTAIGMIQDDKVIDQINKLSPAGCYDFYNAMTTIIDLHDDVNASYIKTCILNYLKNR